ncbi:hypothetical protein VTK73DRAFT_3277 [Phialemonium thermophilum]|uniref:SWIM-type domain-containing protein n=1 Tax=Phialemonium thermophilum TaxID=223376 RepID=A0ABR3Y938_9PEZI
MSTSPTTGIGKLSIESQAPESRSGPMMGQETEDPTERREHSDSDGDDSSAFEDSGEEAPTVVQSPTGLKYSIGHLSEDTQEMVRSLFAHVPDEPHEISLRWCDRLYDPDAKADFYAFQLSELVPRSIRIGSPQSRYQEPQCRCGATPCKHLVWLSDLIASQVLYDHNPDKLLTLNERGFADELGSPFKHISEMGLEVLATGLQCDVGAPGKHSGPSLARKEGVREILASVADIHEHDLASYRIDLLDDAFNYKSIVHRLDFEATLFSILIASHGLTAWVRSHLRPSDPARDPFRHIHQRVLHIISDLEDYSFACRNPAAAAERPASRVDGEGPRDVAWAAKSIERCVEQIQTLISAERDRPLEAWERASAARALVRILRAVVDRNVDLMPVTGPGSTQEDRNLYARLIGNRDTGFIYPALRLLVDQNQFVEELEDILELVGASGVMASWWANMNDIVSKMRSWKRGGGSSSKGKEKVPAAISRWDTGGSSRKGSLRPLNPTVTAPGTIVEDRGEGQALPPSRSATGSLRGRGGVGRAGAGATSSSSPPSSGSLKRSGVGTGSDRGSKRAR